MVFCKVSLKTVLARQRLRRLGGAEAVHAQRILQADDGALHRLQEREAEHERQDRPGYHVEPERHVLEPGLGRVDAVADHVPDEDDDDVRRKIVGAVVVERLPAGIAMVRHLQEAAEQPPLAASRATAREARAARPARPARAAWKRLPWSSGVQPALLAGCLCPAWWMRDAVVRGVCAVLLPLRRFARPARRPSDNISKRSAPADGMASTS